MAAPTPPPTGGAATPSTTPATAPAAATTTTNNPPAPAAPTFFDKLSTPGKGCLISFLAAAGLGMLASASNMATGQRYSAPSGNHSYDESTKTHKYVFPTSSGNLEYTVDADAYQTLLRAQALAETYVGRSMSGAAQQKFFILSDIDRNGQITLCEARDYAPDIARRVMNEE